MRLDGSALRLATIAGLVTWLVIGVPVVLDIVADPSRLLEVRSILWLYAFTSFGVVLFVSERLVSISRAGEYALLAYQTVMAALALSAMPQYGFTAILFIITAVHAAHVFGLRMGFAWISAQTAYLALIIVTNYEDLLMGGVQLMAYFGFQLFALLTTHSAISEARARDDLASVNAELRSMQRLLADSNRSAERVRISRDLHDLIGHHLTALSLNLEVAGHMTEGKAKEHVDKARGIARLLLSDVRDVVSTLRDGDILDLAAALAPLVQDVPRPKVHLSVPDDLGIEDVGRAQVIVRCVQEIVTNAIRHADADNLWIELEKTGSGVEVRARDDGKGAREVRSGHGLAGMRERLEALGGSLTLNSAPGRGFAVNAKLPGGAT